MRRELLLPALASGAALSAAASGVIASQTWQDPANDAIHRPSDDGASRVFFDSVAPDLVSMSLSGWTTTTPATDPYTGNEAGVGAHLFRMDIVFAGLVNPPGELGLGAYTPDSFGDRPVYGFIEIDVDGSADTGGELPAIARQRYLANAGRFGGVPSGSLGARAARSSFDLDETFESGPQYERSGAEFALTLCGCFDPTIVSQDGDLDGVFDAGETWIVRGRFLERFQAANGYSAFFGAPTFGEWSPNVDLRFSHDAGQDKTTITLVYAMDQVGAAALAGAGMVEPTDYDISNHTSIEEAIIELIEIADFEIILEEEIAALIDGWEGRTETPYLDTSLWSVTAIVGTTYTSLGEALYVWTDVGFEWKFGDFDADGVSVITDRDLILSEITAKDGGIEDGDGVVNGSLLLQAFADAFSVYDLNYDGVISNDDVDVFDAEAGPSPDLTGDGYVNGADLATLLASWNTANPTADLNGDGNVDGSDLAVVLAAWTG